MVEVAHASIVGRRNHNEDAVDIHISGDHVFVGIYDGHGGSSTSAMLKKNTYKTFMSNLKSMDVSRALRKTFEMMDDMARSLHHLECGSTAIVAYIVPGDRSSIAYLASVGDSRALLLMDKCKILTVPHNEENLAEKQRIISLGGFFDDGYVNGILNMTRAIGDHEMKKFIISTPEINRIVVRRGSTLILASDGLFDVMNAKEIVAAIDGVETQKTPDHLAQLAYKKGSTDNISVIAVKL